MEQYDSLYKIQILKSKKSIRLSEVSELTSLAIHPIIDGELDVNAALVKQSEGATHFTNQLDTSENIVLIRLTDAQTHKAYLEKQIRMGVVKVTHRQSNIPLDVEPEDMPSQAELFKNYIISQAEFVNYANLLAIDVVIEIEEDQVASRMPAKQSTDDRNQALQIAAEKMAQEYVNAKKPKLTKSKAAFLLSKLPQYSHLKPETIMRVLKINW